MNDLQHHPEMAGGTAEARPPVARPLASGRYIASLVILLVSAGGMRFLANQFAAHFEKQGLPLQKELHRLETGKLAPDYGLALQQPPALSEELVTNLGTEDYLSCYLEDNALEPLDPGYIATLFVTYYTGQPDMVPHAPEECQQAAGWSLADSTTHEFTMLDHLGREVTLPLRVLAFDPPAGGAGSRRIVLYFFYANGEYVTSREGVRLETSDLSDRYAYYAKLELAFYNKRGTPADQETSIGAAEKLLKKLMPVLWKDHFPDWEAVTTGTVAATTDS